MPAEPAFSCASSSRPGNREPLHAGDESASVFCALRVLDHDGPLAALEVANRLPPILRLVGRRTPPPTLPLLLRLEADGLVARSDERPPRYRITPTGRLEAIRLAPAFWSVVTGRIERIDARLEILFDGDVRAGVDSASRS